MGQGANSAWAVRARRTLFAIVNLPVWFLNLFRKCVSYIFGDAGMCVDVDRTFMVCVVTNIYGTLCVNRGTDRNIQGLKPTGA